MSVAEARSSPAAGAARFERASPSPRYRALLELYRRMHRDGAAEQKLAPEQTFPGTSLMRHLKPVRALVVATGARTILDYGSGKGEQYRPQPITVDGQRVADGVGEYWDVDEVRCYDPAFEPHSALPDGRFDGVVCTDVLEHVPEEDLEWVAGELFGFARRFVFVNVACFPAVKTLPNGENAHATVHPPDWWEALLRGLGARHPEVTWELRCAERAGARVTETVRRGGPDAGLPVEPAAAEPEGDAPRQEQAQPAVISLDFDGRTLRFHAPNEMTRWRAQSLLTKEPVTIEWLRAMPEDAVFFDIGANVGVYTVVAAVARDARVWAFEPEAQNYALLNANLALNGLGRRVTALCVAVSDRQAIDRLYLSGLEAGTSCHSFGAEVGFDLKNRPAAFAQGCLSVRLDELVRDGRLPQPEYVKLDVDGFEHQALRGMEAALRDARLRSLIVELNTRLTEHLEIRAWLESLGFAWDRAQVMRAVRTSGTFEGVAEHVFSR